MNIQAEAPQTTGQVLDYDALEPSAGELRSRYASAEPFPHIVLENFLAPAAARSLVLEFPSLDDDAWFHYSHYNEKTRALNEPRLLGPTTRAVIAELQSERFLRWLSALTGFDNLRPDALLESGGLQVALTGGYLNMHADFTVHPHRRDWVRRCNLLLYLNDSWEDCYGGHLELWDRQMQRPVQRIAPLLNRCVIFTTDETTFHGYPDPITCPETTARRSLSLYYFTQEKTPPAVRATDYRARPGEGIRGLWVWLDKKALRVYDLAKRHLGISDRLGSTVMRWLQRISGKKP